MEQLKCIFRESNSKNEGAFMKMSFFEGVILKKFFWGGNFENIFSESIFESIFFCESNFDKYLSWVLIGMTTADWDDSLLGLQLIHLNLDFSFDSLKLTGF